MISQNGRPDDGTDPDGFSNARVLRALEALRQVAQGPATRKPCLDEMFDALQKAVPGVELRFLAVYRGQCARRPRRAVESRECHQDHRQRSRRRCRSSRSTINGGAEPESPGITDVAVPRSLGQPTIRIDIDRDESCALWACHRATSMPRSRLQSGGQAAGDLYEDGSDRHFPMLVRLAPQYRDRISMRSAELDIGAPESEWQRHRADTAEPRSPTCGLVGRAPFYIYREGAGTLRSGEVLVCVGAILAAL